MKKQNLSITAKSIRRLLLACTLMLLPTMASAQCPDNNHPHMIDLGLPSGTKWACCNVGASKPEDYGGYFAWGETEEKDYYDWSTYIHCDGSENTCHDIGNDIAGTQYDAATANWGSPWVMPSLDQIKELLNNCTSKMTIENDIIGSRFTGPSGGTVFLPNAGRRSNDDLLDTRYLGYYWSSSLYMFTSEAYFLQFTTQNQNGGWLYYRTGRFNGLSVRPVVASSPSGIIIDEKTFPDDNFRDWVLAQDYGKDGVLTDEEIANVSTIRVRSANIGSLKGIEYFTELNDLYCSDNLITELDLSKNTKLTELECSGNQLTALDMSKNTALRYLICDYNLLTSLNVTKCTALENLDCENNQLTALDITKNTALTDFACGENLLTSLDVSKNINLEDFDCSNNHLTALNVSNNKVLSDFVCYKNKINGTAMDALIESLPKVKSDFVPISPYDSGEQNVITKSQVAAAKQKGWRTWYINERGRWQEYEGSVLEMEPISNGESIDISTDIDANTSLDGNVVGNIFYNISSGNGSYDSEEGCIIVNKPTDDNAIDGKDILGEDFKDNYTGIVFMVASGKGTIKVEAETQGKMVLKVKIGDNDPIVNILSSKQIVEIPYNVSEPTYIYIYGSINVAGSKGMKKVSGTDALKIYGIEVIGGSDGIEYNNRELITNNRYYNLNGQQMEDVPTQKGVYIKNGKKVLVK